MKIINIKPGVDTVVNDDVDEWAKDIPWRISSCGYVAYIKNSKTVFLHRMIMGTQGTFHTDHKNGDKLDNLRSNLRIASCAENIRNSGIRRDNTTGYKGVSYRKDRRTYSVEISKDGKRTRLGCFKDPKMAAAAYNTSAKEVFGEFARLNEIK